MKKKRVLILYTMAGAGHIAAAKAMKEVLEHDDIAADIIDPFDAFYDSFYKFLQIRARVVWNAIYYVTNNAWCAKWLHGINTFWFQDIIGKALLHHEYDAVISVHGMLTSEVEYVIEKKKLSIPFIIYITDPVSIHSIWLHSKNASYFVPSREGLEFLAQRKKNQVSYQTGWILPYRFYSYEEVQTQQTSILKDELSLLVIGGANGAGIKQLIRAMMNASLQGYHRITVICGRNQGLKTYLEEEYQDDARLHILGFVDHIHDLMKSHDIIIGKAGTAILFEAVACQKPIIVTEKVLAQEKGNVHLVKTYRLGWTVQKTDELIRLLTELKENREELLQKQESVHAFWKPLQETPSVFIQTLTQVMDSYGKENKKF